MKYKVYKNLHNGKWSIQDNKTGLVVGYADSLTLVDVTTKVSEVGRQKVLKEKRKNVHAFIIGDILEVSNFQPRNNRSVVCDGLTEVSLDKPRKITYNPYKFSSFVFAETTAAVPQKMKIAFIDKEVVVVV